MERDRISSPSSTGGLTVCRFVDPASAIFKKSQVGNDELNVFQVTIAAFIPSLATDLVKHVKVLDPDDFEEAPASAGEAAGGEPQEEQPGEEPLQKEQQAGEEPQKEAQKDDAAVRSFIVLFYSPQEFACENGRGEGHVTRERGYVTGRQRTWVSWGLNKV